MELKRSLTVNRGIEYLNCAITSRTRRDETFLCFSLLTILFSGNVTNFPAVLQPSSTCQWFRLLTVCCQRFTHQPIVFCIVRATNISLGLVACVTWGFCRAWRTSGVAPAPISSWVLCPRPPFLLSGLARPTKTAMLHRLRRLWVWLCGQSLFFLLGLPPSFLASRGFAAQRSRARTLPLLNLKKKRDCSQSTCKPELTLTRLLGFTLAQG